MAPFAIVDREAVERYQPGQQPPPNQMPEPGDFILTHGAGFLDALIRFGEWLRFRGPDAKFTYWNHAALIVDDSGGLVEALGDGVVAGNLSKYAGTGFHLVRIKASSQDRAEVVAFGNWCRGQKYGFMTIVSLAFTNVTGCKFSFYIEGQEICSGLVARAEERTGVIFDRDPSHISPADLAKYYSVTP